MRKFKPVQESQLFYIVSSTDKFIPNRHLVLATISADRAGWTHFMDMKTFYSKKGIAQVVRQKSKLPEIAFVSNSDKNIVKIKNKNVLLFS